MPPNRVIPSRGSGPRMNSYKLVHALPPDFSTEGPAVYVNTHSPFIPHAYIRRGWPPSTREGTSDWPDPLPSRAMRQYVSVSGSDRGVNQIDTPGNNKGDRGPMNVVLCPRSLGDPSLFIIV